jgi:small-conductance mechanosensitive channel
MNVNLSSSFSSHIIHGINTILPRLPNALFDLALGILIIRLTVRLVRFVLKITNVQLGLRGVLTSTLETFMWIFLLIALLSELGFSGVVYFFTGSIAAIGIAMAAGGSTFISDIVAGVFLARDPDFNIGDEVVVGAIGAEPTKGIIEDIDVRRTRIRDDEGVLHVFPNTLVERNQWIVVHRRSEVSALVKATKAAKALGAAARQRRDAARQRRAVGKNDQ